MKIVLAVLLATALCIGPCTGVSLRGNTPARETGDNLVHLVKRNDPPNDSSWISKHIIPVAVGGGGGLLLFMCVIVVLVILCACYFKRKNARTKELRRPLLQNGHPGPRYGGDPSRRETGVVEAMNRERRDREAQEKKKANDSVQYFLRNNTQYHYESELNDLGSRMQKHWFKVTSTEGEKGQVLLLTTTPVSQKCPLKLESNTQKGMNKLVKELRKHPFLQPVVIVEYLAAQQQLVIVQPFHAEGSLKDTIYRATPTTDWSNKYSRRSKGLTVDKIKLYGRQILEAMSFLYETGFPALGHVQSGNVFIVNDVCLLGGYENTLLGYKTRLYKMCKEYHDRLDVIMFGHLLFEMCCGYELTSVVPTEQDYKSAKKDEVKAILEFVFKAQQVEDIKNHAFFAMTLTQLEEFDPSTVKTSTSSIEHVLEKVRKGKPRQQKVQKPKDEATPQAPPTEPAVTPPPTRDTNDATPVPVDTPTKGAEPEPGTVMDSAGDQSGDSKEGKRKGRFKFSRGGKKKKESTTTGATGGGESGTDPDKTPIQSTLEEQA